MKKKKKEIPFSFVSDKGETFLADRRNENKKKKLKRKQKPGIGRKSRVSSIQTEDIFVNIIS